MSSEPKVVDIADFAHGRPFKSQLQLRSREFLAGLPKDTTVPPHVMIRRTPRSGGTPAAARAA
jgi:hypothetical protein